MTDQTIQPPPEERDDDFEAAEFALGLTPADIYPATRDRVLRDRRFALLVAAWQERLAAMTNDLKEVRPKRRVKQQILARVFPRKARVPLMERLWVWQGIALGALVLAAYLATPLLRPDAPSRATGPIFATELVGDDSGYQVFAVLDPSRQGIALRRVAGEVPAGRVLELWAILPDAAPVSLGVVPPEPEHLPLPPEFASQINVLTLAISDEPPGGSPTGAPTGTVLALGVVSEL